MYDSIDDVTVEPNPGHAVVTFRGEHDLSDRDAVEKLLSALVDEHEVVVVDFSEALFVDSTMPHVLLNGDLAARERGRALRLQLGTSAIVRRAFELSGVLERLETFESREAALADASAG